MDNIFRPATGRLQANAFNACNPLTALGWEDVDRFCRNGPLRLKSKSHHVIITQNGLRDPHNPCSEKIKSSQTAEFIRTRSWVGPQNSAPVLGHTIDCRIHLEEQLVVALQKMARSPRRLARGCWKRDPRRRTTTTMTSTVDACSNTAFAWS